MAPVIRPVSMVLSGSGTRFYAFIGALRVLFEAGYHPRQLLGTSGGGLVALYVAAHYNHTDPVATIRALEAFARTFRVGDMLDLGGVRWPRFWHGLYKGDKILAKLRSALPTRWSDMRLPVYVVTSDRSADAAKIWGPEDVVEPALVGRATCSLPIFDAVNIRGHWHTDGGTRANYPLAFFGTGEDVIGLRFRPRGGAGVLRPGESGPVVQDFNGKADFQFDNIDDMIEATSRAHMDAATKARTVMLDVPGSGMDFAVSDAEVDAMIAAGAQSARKWLAGQ